MERLYLKSLEDYHKIKDVEWAYAAGMLDADGSISITMTYNLDRKGRPYKAFDCKSEISNTAASIILWLHERFGGKSYICVNHISKKAKANGQKRLTPCHRWYADGRELQIAFIEGILPYLVIKREQAEIALEYLKMGRKIDPEYRYKLHLEISALNNKESVTTNTPDASTREEVKIESDLHGDMQSGLGVIQEVA